MEDKTYQILNIPFRPHYPGSLDSKMIRPNVSVEEIRGLAGHTLPQWRKFISITRTISTALVSQNPTSTLLGYTYLPTEQKLAIRREIDEECNQQGIPTVSEEVLEWRMDIALGDARRRAGIRNAC
ncbi:hypothetical protein BU24DRAFT_252814 [Aaosphaeria arxii CBS 175.79]|uniref:Uncharacterized protein n=1 Tax=Aaosphaeria arxii CBS 175.79 TaxID=1450172 RepID=A0A6A5XH12_9PLEO|nr:uncharacterized protein BU24DRAFT_252814 [Aaosphaeria arxii CBS 175.79]KAF2012478.1 hypothetical protein BU24DRAFT_252814 [Aaosphaeria arxii CBS 175.79]